MSVSQKTQFHGVGDDKKGIGNTIYGTKVSSEISYAIRRQREISGVDYLKAKAPTQTDKNVIASKISNVSLDGYFPFSIYSQLKTDKSQTRRTKKGGKFASLNRSKSSVSLSLPSGRNMSSGQGVPHSVVVTDLTCLQLADTLFSSNLASSLGLSSQSTDKLKYTNIPSDKRNLFIGENDKSLYTNFKNNGATSSIPLPALNSPGRSSHPKKDPQRPNSSTGVKTVLHPTIVNEKEELSPKSILKQTSVEKQPEVNCKGPKYRTLSDKAPKKNTCPETPRCITVKASKIGLQSRNATVKNCTLDFDDKDKRSVRFNVSHEIFEFAPYDPVCT